MNLTITVLIVFIMTLMTIGVPIVWSMTISSFLAILIQGDIPIAFFTQRMFTGGEKYALLAVFFFIFAGVLMKEGGLARRLVNFSNTLVGHKRGGLSLVIIIACIFFAAISGSSVATTVAIGSMLYPSMLEQKYPADYAAAIPAVGGVLGVIIPPSITFVLYGTVTNTSISKLLMSGIIPGILGGLALMIVAYMFAKKNDLPVSGTFDLKTSLKSFKEAFFALLMPIIILGGIYGGIFTPTESAAVAVAYGLIVSAFIYKEINFKKLCDIMLQSVKSTANIMVLVMGATMFSWILTANNIHVALSNWITTTVSSPIVFLLLVNVVLLLIGMILEAGATILILAPLLAPIAVSYGIDPVHFGLIMLFNLAIGQATPPYGVCLFASSDVCNRKVMAIGKQSLPFVAALIGVVLLCTFVPQISLWLPNLLQ